MLPSAVAGGKTQKWLGGATHLQASPLLPDIQKHVLRCADRRDALADLI